MYKIACAMILCSLQLNGALVSRVAMLCNPALSSLSSVQGVATQRRALTQDETSTTLLKGFESMLKSGYCASNALYFAVENRDHPFVASLLHVGAKPHESHIIKAASLEDYQAVALLLPKVKTFELRYDAHRLSFGMMRLLLENGGRIARGSAVGDLFASHLEPIISAKKWEREYSPLREVECVYLLKKTMLLVFAGDSLKFGVTNPLSCEESMAKYKYWSGVIDCRCAEGDWTFGVFPDFARYIQAALVFRNTRSTPAAKDQALLTITEIMNCYGIDSREVIIGTEDLSGSVRMVEEDLSPRPLFGPIL